MDRHVARGAVFCWAVMVASVSGGRAQEQPFRGEIEVSRVVLRVRVVDATGEPVRGLGPRDFEVRLDGRAASVETVEWVAEGRSEEEPPPEAAPPEAPLPHPEEPAARDGGRLLVILFQTDLRHSRITGLMRVDERAAELVRTLAAHDRVAVAVFGSHLELHCDFTDDHEAVAARLGAIDILADDRLTAAPGEPSLARRLDSERARRAATIEAALEVLGDALAELPGAKDVLYFGWGAGRYDGHSGMVHLGRDYERARDALARARANVFAIDFTDADSHSLELGMQQVAEDTGGLYLKTNAFPDVAMARLTRALSGYYEVVLLPPADLPDRFEIRVRAHAHGAEVLASRWQHAEDAAQGSP